MIVERALQLGQYALGQAVLGHDQYRFQVVADRFEVFLLFVGKRHNLTLLQWEAAPCDGATPVYPSCVRRAGRKVA